jgi:membrane associated rhomboid family serine protease
MLLPLQDNNPTVRPPFVVYGLIAINIAVMLWQSQLTPLDENIALVKHGFIPQRIAQLSDPQLVVRVPIVLEQPEHNVRFLAQQARPAAIVELDPLPRQILASIFTTMFLHGGWLHLAGNMWFLWIFGNNVEDRLGHALFLIFYLVGGVLATTCHWAYDPRSLTPVVGASGAIATILGAYAVTWPKAEVRTFIFFGFFTIVEIPALIWLGLWFAGQVLDAIVVGKGLGVAVWAHIGGFVAGAFLMPILSFGAPPPGSNWHEEIKKHFSFDPPDR